MGMTTSPVSFEASSVIVCYFQESFGSKGKLSGLKESASHRYVRSSIFEVWDLVEKRNKGMTRIRCVYVEKRKSPHYESRGRELFMIGILRNYSRTRVPRMGRIQCSS